MEPWDVDTIAGFVMHHFKSTRVDEVEEGIFELHDAMSEPASDVEGIPGGLGSLYGSEVLCAAAVATEIAARMILKREKEIADANY